MSEALDHAPQALPPARASKAGSEPALDVVDIGIGGRRTLLADQLVQLDAVTHPDARAQIVEQLVYGERLLTS